MNETKNHNPARYISRYLALRIVVKPAFTKEVDGRIVTVQGKDVRFVEGVFETKDQELIDYLEADKSFGSTYIRVQDNVSEVVNERNEWMKDLEARELDLKRREAELKDKETRVKGSEEGSKVEVEKDELKANMSKADLLAIAEAEGVEGVDKDTKNAEIIAAIRENRDAKKEGNAEDAQF